MTFASNIPVQARIQRHHDALVKRLSAHSSQYRDPVSTIPWESLDADSAWLPDSLVSLYGLPEYEQLSVDERTRLSQVTNCVKKSGIVSCFWSSSSVPICRL